MKIIGIFVCLLLVIATVSQVAGIVDKEDKMIGESIFIETEQEISVLKGDIDWWPMFKHDLQNTGNSSSITAPQTNNILWTYVTGWLVSCSPAIVNDKVYIGSDDEYFYCLNPDTGAIIWRNWIPGGTSHSSPCVVDGKVYQSTTYDHIFCWDAETGEEIWRFYKGYGGSQSAVVYNEKVYFSFFNITFIPNIYCLDADTGKKIWNRTLEMGEINHIAVYDGKVYVPHYWGKLFCLDGETGDTLWVKSHTGRHGAPAIENDKLYATADGILCLDPDTGEEIWHYQGATSSCSPAIAYSRIYYVSNDGKILCLDADTGVELWNYSFGGNNQNTYSSPAIADGKMYVGIGKNGKLLCLDANNGEFIWDYKISPGSPSYLYSSPAIVDGKLYVGGGLGSLTIYCFEDPSKPPTAPTIVGPIDCILDIEHEFRFRSIDPEDEDIKYYIDWGDGTNTGWFGPYESGKSILVSHKWNETGIYVIKVRAEDEFGIKGHWSEQIISVIDEPALEIRFIKGGLLKVSSVVKNYGSRVATDVNWSITLDGGFIIFGRKTTGNIDDIPSSGEASIASNLVIGFGPILVKVNVSVPVGISDTREQKGVLILFFIKVDPSGQYKQYLSEKNHLFSIQYEQALITI